MALEYPQSANKKICHLIVIHILKSTFHDEQGHISVHIFCGNASVVLERILDHLVNVIGRIQMFDHVIGFMSDQLNQL